MTEAVDHTEPDAPDAPATSWRILAGVVIGGGAIVIAALIGVGAIKSEGSTNVRGGPGGFGGGPPGQQFQFQGQPPPPPFAQQQQPPPPRQGR